MKKERPILFSTPMVQAILNEKKTQTRRVVKPQPIVGLEKVTECLFLDQHTSGIEPKVFKCPYGKPGDVLWVRETWAETTNVNDLSPWPGRPHLRTDDIDDRHTPWRAIIYRADGDWSWCDADGRSTDKSHWKPSIHMPKNAARIWLEITDVRVERLQDISWQDANREGMERDYDPDDSHNVQWKNYMGGNTTRSEIRSFMTLWQSINGEQSWNENPWVWVVEFKRIEKP